MKLDGTIYNLKKFYLKKVELDNRMKNPENYESLRTKDSSLLSEITAWNSKAELEKANREISFLKDQLKQ